MSMLKLPFRQRRIGSSGYRPRPYRILNRTPRIVASAFRAVFPQSKCDVCFVMIFIAHLSKIFLRFFYVMPKEVYVKRVFHKSHVFLWNPGLDFRQKQIQLGNSSWSTRQPPSVGTRCTGRSVAVSGVTGSVTSQPWKFSSSQVRTICQNFKLPSGCISGSVNR